MLFWRARQVCALFNARANVGEAKFVCPLCRLGDVSVARSGKPFVEVSERGLVDLVTEQPYGARIHVVTM